MREALAKDPFNIVITGVGGQGNVMASRVLSNMLVRKGFKVTIGETFGMSQRGGSVMSHIRVSPKAVWSPQIPKGMADLIVALEPIEAIRVLADYGNPSVKVLVNLRAIYPVGVITGEDEYPSTTVIRDTVAALATQAHFLAATDEAIGLGNPSGVRSDEADHLLEERRFSATAPSDDTENLASEHL
jgi:indolepyruvate ferredoxin oxidoreductase beta subunit